MIAGVHVRPLRQIVSDLGSVFHWWRADDPAFAGFGEAYFSFVNPGRVKAWKRHTRMTMALVVPIGRLKLVLYDDRPDSPTNGIVQEIVLGAAPADYCCVVIPPMVWNGFVSLTETPTLLANCASIPHDPTEIDRAPADSRDIPYDWANGTLQ